MALPEIAGHRQRPEEGAEQHDRPHLLLEDRRSQEHAGNREGEAEDDAQQREPEAEAGIALDAAHQVRGSGRTAMRGSYLGSGGETCDHDGPLPPANFHFSRTGSEPAAPGFAAPDGGNATTMTIR